jgi:protein-S-isoprenylcysteine O-methyltransferase Ste14
MSNDSAHKSNWEIAEVVFGIPFLLSIALHFLIPLPFPQEVPGQVLIPVGIALIILGVSIILLGRRAFSHFNQPTDPGRPTSRVIKTGVFSISRNPLYLGCVFVLSGVSLTTNVLWVAITLLPAIIICHYVLILPEEQYLADKFCDEYKEYFNAVHRWLGRK